MTNEQAEKQWQDKVTEEVMKFEDSQKWDEVSVYATFEHCQKFVRSNISSVPEVIELKQKLAKHTALLAMTEKLVQAHEGALTRNINGDTRIDSHAYREIKQALAEFEAWKKEKLK